jgi:serine protease inhibitor
LEKLRFYCRKNTADITLKKFAMLVTDQARPIKNDYEVAVERTYEADVQRVNFLDVDKTLKIINDEVSRKTEGEITDTVMREDLFKVSCGKSN